MAVNSFNAQNPPVTTKGDVFTFSTIPTRLGVGANNTVLTADSTTATGLKWATPTASGRNYSLLNTGGTALTGAATITISGISGKDSFLILVAGASSASANTQLYLRFNSDTGNNYSRGGPVIVAPSTYAASSFDEGSQISAGQFFIAQGSSAANCAISAGILVEGGNSSGVKAVSYSGGASAAGGNGQILIWGDGVWNNSATISSISIISTVGNWDAGTVYVYASA